MSKVSDEPAVPAVAQSDPLPGVDLVGVRHALLRYRIMAWLVGILLVVLVCFAMPLKYLLDIKEYSMWIGISHGWLYPVLLITAYDLGRRVQWSLKRLGLIALAGTVPFVTFIAEHYATKDIKTRLLTSSLCRKEAETLAQQ